MSEAAFKIYEEALKEQHNRNEARRIRTRVAEARGSPHSAGLRWPFELLQNALDTGPRSGRSCVSISLRQTLSTVIFEHDGAPFTSEELAALLSGGSSKEFESEVTTGRFGTGFLVTHVLAERAELSGLLEVPAGYEQFNLVLDRSGDEDTILENIHSCNDAIRSARPVPDSDGLPSAIFEYPITDDNSLILGINALKSALPYLYITRRKLGPFRIEGHEGKAEVWTPGEIKIEQIEGGYIEYRSLFVKRNGTDAPELRVLRFTTNENAAASALVLVEQMEGNLKVLLPGAGEPRIYREYPLRGSGFLPISFVFDGKFEPDQERSKLLMKDVDKEMLEDAFAAAVAGTKHAIDQRWRDAHWLARANKSLAAFDPTNPEERDWWNDQQAAFAARVAKLPVIECKSRFLPAITSEDWYAYFVIPRLLDDSGEDETSVERLWPLVDAATDLEPPHQELAADWTEIAAGWHDLGLELGRATVRRLAEYVRGDAVTLDELKVSGDRLEWLAKFLDIVGECWSKRSGVDASMLAGILPDQNKRLRSTSELSIDDGVSEELKDICAEMGYDFRSEVLLASLTTGEEAAGLAFLPQMISQAIPSRISEHEVIERAMKKLDDKLPEDEECDQSTVNAQRASIRLLSYLWRSKGKDVASIAKKIALITSNGRAVRWSHDRMMMVPVRCWHETAQPFARAYPPDRILADMYAESDDQGSIGVISPLVQWGIAIGDPLTIDTPVELKERRLAAIGIGDTDGVVISHEEFSQIALLQPELLNRCQEGIDEAQALLGLVLCHIAPHDPKWKEERSVKGRKARQDVHVTVRGALWLADLKFRSWVPVPGEDGKPVKMAANASTLKNILNPGWLDKNDSAIQLLSQWFEFDELELRLLGLAPDKDKRQELRDGLAKLVEFGGADPELYKSLAEEIETRRRRSRDVERCRRLGIAVQEAIKIALEKHKLKVRLVDRGFDYEVTSDNVIEDGVTEIEVGPYLLEVKATTRGEARLTPLQANTASQDPSKYVLCVVDLRQVSDEELDADWDATRVESLAKVVTDIGGKVTATCKLISAAKIASVGIRNESSLRYEVPSQFWEAGISISEWVFSTWQHLGKAGL
jgi:hypothetical protein